MRDKRKEDLVGRGTSILDCFWKNSRIAQTIQKKPPTKKSLGRIKIAGHDYPRPCCGVCNHCDSLLFAG
jgi:hypothetical protein